MVQTVTQGAQTWGLGEWVWNGVLSPVVGLALWDIMRDEDMRRIKDYLQGKKCITVALPCGENGGGVTKEELKWKVTGDE